MDYAELCARDVKDLRVFAAQYGIKTHHKAKAETIAKLIVEHISKPQDKPEDMKHPAEKPKEPLVIHTEAEVRQAIDLYDKKNGFVVTFPQDNTWIFQCRGAEESGHMSAPLRVIRMKAESVSKGARRMVTVKNELGQDVIMA